MKPPTPAFGQIGLLFALLQRLMGLWVRGRTPPAPVVRTLVRAETTLAADIRATLTADAVAFPELPDQEFLVWFARHFLANGETPRPVSAAIQGLQSGKKRQRSRQAASPCAKKSPAARSPRAPP